MPAQFLTDRQLVLSQDLTENDLIHIVKTGDTTQSPQGSSYKANISLITPLINVNQCCLTDVLYQNGTLIFGNANGTAFTVNNVAFQGGSGNCINEMFTQFIYPCTGGTAQSKHIRIMSATTNSALKNIHFGVYNVITTGATFLSPQQLSAFTGTVTGFTINFTKTSGQSARLGLNLYPNQEPGYTIDFYTYDRTSRLIYDESLNVNQKITFYSDSMFQPNFSTVGYFPGNSQNIELEYRGVGITIGHKGSITFTSTYTAATNFETGGPFTSTVFTNPIDLDAINNNLVNTTGGLSILTPNGATSKPAYIRFYAGVSVSGNSYLPHVHIQGTGSTLGFMGVGYGNINPTSWLDISGSTGTNQLRLRQPYIVGSTGSTQGYKGDIVWSSGSTSYLYIKISDANTGGHAWRRINLI